MNSWELLIQLKTGLCLQRDQADLQWQEHYHQRMATLLQQLDQHLARYTEWKCHFVEGIPPKGFTSILSTVLQCVDPTEKSKPFRSQNGEAPPVHHLIWVKLGQLSLAVKGYDPTTAKHIQEMRFYVNALQGKTSVLSPESYQQFMPDLLDFIRYGQDHNLELCLRKS